MMPCVKNILAALCVLACTFFVSCTRGLDTSAEIRYAAQSEDAALGKTASRLRGMTLVQDPAPEYWTIRMRGDRESPLPHDLFLVEWGREIVSAQEAGDLAALGKTWPRTASSRRMPAFSGSIIPSPEEGFIPSAIYTWGIFYNRKIMAELGSPAIDDMDAFVARCNAAKGRGIVPIALGASFGWPGAAWHTYVDLRLNGGKAAWERVMGRRPFDDAGGREAAELLAAWRDAGFFSPDAARTGMQESLTAVESGRALCVLMGSFTAERFVNPGAIGFIEVPFWKNRGQPRGEIAGLTGFAVAAASKKPQAALALVDAYLEEGSPGQAAGGYTLPIRFRPRDGEDLRAVQSRILAKTAWLLLPQEQIMPLQFFQDSLKVWAGFFERKPGSSGADLAGALQALYARSR